MLRTLSAVLALTLTAGVATADSFMSSTYVGAAATKQLGYTPYKGTELSAKQAIAVADRGARLMKTNRNTAVRLDVIRAVYMATENSSAAREHFTHALTQLVRGTSASERFARGYNLVVHHDSADGLAMVRNAARTKVLSRDAAAQLGAFEAHAAYATEAQISPEVRMATLREAAAFLRAAKALPQARTRPLVAKGIKRADEYIKYYPEIEALTK